MEIEIEEITFHRNGICGNPFHVVKFLDCSQEQEAPMLAVVFSEDNSIAVFDRNFLKREIITFGQNSFRGDVYEPFLREEIKKYRDTLRNL